MATQVYEIDNHLDFILSTMFTEEEVFPEEVCTMSSECAPGSPTRVDEVYNDYGEERPEKKSAFNGVEAAAFLDDLNGIFEEAPNAGGCVIDVCDAMADSPLVVPEAPKRKRGRPLGSKNGSKKPKLKKPKKSQEEISALSKFRKERRKTRKNDRERVRRIEVNQLFETLNSMIDKPVDMKADKSILVKACIDCVERLQEELAELQKKETVSV